MGKKITIKEQPCRCPIINGDLLVGDKWVKSEIYSYDKDEKKAIRDEFVKGYHQIGLVYLNQNTWLPLDALNISNGYSVGLKFRYGCQFNGNVYYAFLPWIILALDPEVYKPKEGEFPPSKLEIAFDSEWCADFLGGDTYHGVGNALQGHGYIDPMNINDGSPSLREGILELSNGDLILGRMQVWHNK